MSALPRPKFLPSRSDYKEKNTKPNRKERSGARWSRAGAWPGPSAPHRGPAPQGDLQCGLQCSQGWGTDCLSGQTGPGFHHSHRGKFLLYIQSDLGQTLFKTGLNLSNPIQTHCSLLVRNSFGTLLECTNPTGYQQENSQELCFNMVALLPPRTFSCPVSIWFARLHDLPLPPARGCSYARTFWHA